MRTIHLFPPSIFGSVTATAFARWFAGSELIAKHEFWILERGASAGSLPIAEMRAPGLRWLRDTHALPRLLALPPGTRLVVHGLFGAALCLAICLRPDLARHALWMIWGADLEPPAPSERTRKLSVYMHDRAAHSFGVVLSVMRDDHEKAIARFGASARWRNVFYPGIIDEKLLGTVSRHCEPVRELRRVVVGNSASASNRHQALLEQLPALEPNAASFFLPLSYGDPIYRDQVIQAWRAHFGGAVTAMTEFMSLPDYARFLASVDCGVYCYERQQGLGNILMLLALGKPVYLLEGSQTQRYLSELGFVIPGISRFVRELGQPLASDMLQACVHNRELCLRLFSDQACRELWCRALGIETGGT